MLFLVPLVLGFVFNTLSVPTTRLCRRFGEDRGRRATFILRNVLGIPVWTIGMALAVRTPSAHLFATSRTADLIGWLLLAAGCALMLLALLALRRSAAFPSTHDPLVRRGPYAHVRHPIHSGLLLAFAALIVLRPTRVVLLAAGIAVTWILVQSRLEELDLVQRLPSYRAYMEHVPRFIPRLGGRAT